MGLINKEHQFRDAKNPLRKPIKGTKKGEQAKEADALVQKALQLIEFFASKKAEQLRTGEMMVVEVDLRGMEWLMENPVGMLAMKDYMQQFVEEFQYDVVTAKDRRLLRLGPLLPEANCNTCMDQHDLLGADWDAGGGHERQSQLQRRPHANNSLYVNNIRKDPKLSCSIA